MHRGNVLDRRRRRRGVNTHVGYIFLTEVGPNLDRFASPEYFCSRLATALRMAAQSLNRVESPLGDWFRRMRAKLGPAGAVTAAAHKLTRILYTMIKTRTAFDPTKLGNPALIRQRKERSLRKQAALLGFSLQPANAGAVS